MKVQLTLEDLNEFQATILEKSTDFKKAETTFSLMASIGCRASEAMQQNFIENDEKSYLLVTKKRNFDRVILASRIPDDFLNCIKDRNMEYALASYSTINFYFERFRPYAIYNTKKECSTHIFRHIYAKNLKKIGYSMEEIKEDLGEKHLASVFQYVYSELYKLQ